MRVLLHPHKFITGRGTSRNPETRNQGSTVLVESEVQLEHKVRKKVQASSESRIKDSHAVFGLMMLLYQ